MDHLNQTKRFAKSNKELSDQLATVKQRLEELEPYLRHLDGCEMNIYNNFSNNWVVSNYKIPCTCGLDDLLK